MSEILFHILKKGNIFVKFGPFPLNENVLFPEFRNID